MTVEPDPDGQLAQGPTDGQQALLHGDGAAGWVSASGTLKAESPPNGALGLASGLELVDTLRHIVNAATDLVGARFGALGVMNDEGALGQFIYSGIEDVTRALIGPLPTGRGLLQEQEPLRLDDFFQHPTSAGIPAHHSGMSSFIGVSVGAHGAAFGWLYLTEKVNGEPFDARDEVVIEALAAAAGMAVDNSRLHDELRYHQRRLEASGEITVHLLQDGDPLEALGLAARHALDLTGADYALIAVPGPGLHDVSELTIDVCVGMGANTVIGRTVPLVGTTTGAVYADQLPRSVDKLVLGLAEDHSIGFGPALVLPLRTRDSVAGVLLAVRSAGAPPFDEADLQVVSWFADQAALIMHYSDNQTTRREM